MIVARLNARRSAHRTRRSSLSRPTPTFTYRNKFIKRAKASVAALLPDGWSNPLGKLKRINEKGAERTRERRAANDAQLAALFGLTLPDDRRLCYALAVYNGLWRNEVAGLRWTPLELDKPIPFVGLPQKMGEGTDYIPLHPYVLKLLRDRTKGMSAVRVVGSVPDMETTARDLLRAGIAAKAVAPGTGVITIAPSTPSGLPCRAPCVMLPGVAPQRTEAWTWPSSTG